MSKTIQKTVCNDLKILPQYFLPVFTGKKTFEIRYNDRNFHTGDFIRLREWSNGEYTGNYVVKQITYILRDGMYGLRDGFVGLALSNKDFGNQILGIEPLESGVESNE